ncbi:hypothetical protein ACHAXN_003885 [Cyclotella atomus]|jgi:hypothetical protein
MAETNPNRPSDGPATKFIADHLVTSLFTREADYFGLVLVAGWPPNQMMDQAYQQFLDEVRSCFHKSDLESAVGPPNVYLYPTQCLHVTIATLHHVHKKRPDLGKDYYYELTEKYVDLVKAASQCDAWPKCTNQVDRDGSVQSPPQMKLQLELVQLGQKAGILLWNDKSGYINAMRDCLQKEATQRGIQIDSIPNIIHSTFLRFAHEPIHSGSGEAIQQKFQSIVIPKANAMFSVTSQPDSYVWDDSLCKLVCETMPYMHIPNDEEHVYLKL